jgi:predicted nucleic acid-binding protein
MTPVFADTFYFLAIVNPRDVAHIEAVSFAASSKRPMITTEWIIMEVADALCSVQNRPVFTRLYRNIQKSQIAIVTFSDDLMKRGIKLFESRPDKEWPLTDCVSFVVMADLGVSDALTGDRHFAQAGFKMLLP